MNINKKKKCIKREIKDNFLNYTPLKVNAFKISDNEKILLIEKYFKKIMEVLGLDISDDSLKNTPKRVSKMYVKEIFHGLNNNFLPKVSLFKNKYNYNEIIIEKDINVFSTCEHHLLPIIGKAHVGYIPNTKIIGLSKINRIVNYFSRRPQLQERLTIQIVKYLQTKLSIKNVACIIIAKHLCVNYRGINDICSKTITSKFGGIFNKKKFKDEFLYKINIKLI